MNVSFVVVTKTKQRRVYVLCHLSTLKSTIFFQCVHDGKKNRSDRIQFLSDFFVIQSTWTIVMNNSSEINDRHEKNNEKKKIKKI